MEKKRVKDATFKLLKPLEGWKKGHVFECFGGLVSGVCGISFTNKEYFKVHKVVYFD